MTGSKLFSRYVLPCHLSQEEFDKIKRFAKGEEEPDVAFLEQCFPRIVKELKDWSLESVAEYWHQHQGSGENCVVRPALICSVGDNGVVEVLCNYKTFNVLNLCEIPLDGVVSVFIHGGVIAEVEF